MSLCGGCNNVISVIDKLACSSCSSTFHYACIGTNKESFSKMSSRAKTTWKCHNCKPKKKKEDEAAVVGVNTECADLDVDKISQHQFDRLEELIKSSAALLRSEFQAFRKEFEVIAELQNATKFLSDQCDEFAEGLKSLQSEVKCLKSENTQLQQNVKELNTKVLQMEQQARECNVEIQCIPEHRNENLVNTMMQLAKTVSCPLVEKDLLNCTRVAKQDTSSSRPKSTILKLSSPRLRDTLLSCCLKFNKDNPNDKLNTSHLGFGGDKSPIFVNEHLSPSNRDLQAKARSFKKNAGYKHLWVRGGRILMRKDDKSPVIWVKSMDTLDKLTKS